MALNCLVGTTGQVNFNHVHQTFCFPEVVRCSFLPSGLLVPCGETWNCNLRCDTDSKYSIPIPADGLIYLQTAFFDNVSADRRIPTASFDDLVTLEICSNLDNDYVEITVDEIGEANNCFDGKYNRQNICINAALIDPDIECFNLRMTVGDVCIESQQFRIERRCDVNLVRIESDGFNDDCDGYFYDDFEFCNGPDIQFSNAIYLRAGTKYFGGEISSEYLGRLKTSASVLERLRIIGDELIPPYMAQYLLTHIFGGGNFTIDGVEYDSEQNVSLTPSDKNSMFHVNLEFTNTCERSFGCS